MGEHTEISWADSTLNIWEGCQETASPACVGCYARERNRRYAPEDGPREPDTGLKVAPNWGPRAPRREVKSWRANLRKISRLAKAAFAAGRTDPWLVFVNSLSDFFDNQADAALRAEAMDEFRKHPHLTFLLLTKRPQNISKMATAMAEAQLGPYADEAGIRSWWPRNVAIGCTVVTQAEADRDAAQLLIAAAALQPAAVFLSIEPMAEAMDIRWALSRNALEIAAGIIQRGNFSPGLEALVRIGWVIAGGGTDQGRFKATPSHPDWFRDLRDQCAAAGVPFHFKQWGEWSPDLDAAYSNTPRHRFRIDAPAPEFEGLQNWLVVARIGKKAAGRILDGRTHDDRPENRP